MTLSEEDTKKRCNVHQSNIFRSFKVEFLHHYLHTINILINFYKTNLLFIIFNDILGPSNSQFKKPHLSIKMLIKPRCIGWSYHLKASFSAGYLSLQPAQIGC